MRNLSILMIVILLVACSGHHKRLTANEKSKFVSELIDDSAGCNIYKVKLAEPISDEDKVDVIFRAAIKAHCVKKDV